MATNVTDIDCGLRWPAWVCYVAERARWGYWLALLVTVAVGMLAVAVLS